jgi:hypothetical protein
MAGPSSGAPRESKKISGAYLSLIAVAFSELRRDTTLLVDSGWAEAVRRRAHELASTLADACEKQGLTELAAHCRATANLARLTKANAAPIESALREKFDALHRAGQQLLAKHSNRYIG